MIYVMTEEGEDGKVYVSHGVDSETFENIVLPQEEFSVFRLNCVWKDGGYVLKDEKCLSK